MGGADYSKIRLTLLPQGKTMKVRRLKEGHIPELTEFNFAVVEFGHIFNDLKDKTLPLAHRRQKSTKNIRVLAYESPQTVIPALETVTQLANLPDYPYRNHRTRFRYQNALAQVHGVFKEATAFQAVDELNNKNGSSSAGSQGRQPVELHRMMAQESERAGIGATLGFLLERGALLVGAFYHYPPESLGRVVAKRLDYATGEFGLGLSNLILPQNASKFQKLHIQEDCIATGDSIAGSILALKKKGLGFTEVQIDAIVATQTGTEFLRDYLKTLGLKKVVIRAGALCFRLDEHFYLRRTKEEGYQKDEYFVGDMGEWSRILPKSYNQVAWWNKNRLDY